ncbi:hypothetical protein BS78_01G509700 [Paspalum vaginatum]|uniref:Bifunctional inhibitor/plant lipid transfer protein/seed storage helical domain-containing protein n=1 Tax=Paspalum vaginatum TaxID=158149 RepID=A0A140GYP0_9POAL|nr:hypothetical protein [Paspalum vaginatum]KAJ1299149.1 hypothetical protein BS78_01G509700 [Paspalum vaginatum]
MTMMKVQAARGSSGRLPLACALLLLLLLSASAGVASAASCNAAPLAACAGALATGGKPSSACCSSLKAQQSCFCTYAKNPAYARYINSPNARKAVTSCGVSVPRC